MSENLKGDYFDSHCMYLFTSKNSHIYNNKNKNINNKNIGQSENFTSRTYRTPVDFQNFQ